MSVELQVGGTVYAGWTSLDATISVAQLAGNYKLSVSDRWDGQATPWRIQPGDLATLLLDGATVITGPVDTTSPEYSATSYGIGVEGRDSTGDLIDCSVPQQDMQLTNVTLGELAARLAKPYGISVTVQKDSARIPKVDLTPGEAVWEALDRVARAVALLIVSDGGGGIEIIEPASRRVQTALELGVNLLSAQAQLSMTERYSDYYVLAQDSTEMATEVLGHATDKSVGRHRPLSIMAEHGMDATQAQTRAEWEATVRAARSTAATVVVAGWSHAGGLWRPDRVVSLRDAYLGVERDVYIESCQYLLDDEGQRTRLKLVGPKAYQRIAQMQLLASDDADAGVLS